MATIRLMQPADFAWVRPLMDDAFCRIMEELYGRPAPRPFFPAAQLPYRHAADPSGCWVAEENGAPAGALVSVARGRLGWFGPVAVAPEQQGRGVGQSLISVCLEVWRGRGVRLMGLETMAVSAAHIHLYSKFGFRPAWTGLTLHKKLAASIPPAGVSFGGPLPELDFVYPGLNIAAEAAATAACGEVLVTEGGVALCHVENTVRPSQRTAVVPFLAAKDAEACRRLLGAAEALAWQKGKSALTVRLPGSCWEMFRLLRDRGYQPGPAHLRMKLGEQADYDHAGLYYCDSWL